MQKLTFIFIIGAVLILSTSSCSKEKNCECITSYSKNTVIDIPDITTTFKIKGGDCSEANRIDSTGYIRKHICTEK